MTSTMHLPNSGLRITALAKRLISIAQAACDVGECEVAGHVLHTTETLMSRTGLIPKDRLSLAKLVVGTHQRLWEIRNRRPTDMLPAIQQEIRPRDRHT